MLVPVFTSLSYWKPIVSLITVSLFIRVFDYNVNATYSHYYNKLSASPDFVGPGSNLDSPASLQAVID